MPATRFWDYYLIILIEQFSNLSTTGLYTMELISNTIYMRKGIEATKKRVCDLIKAKGLKDKTIADKLGITP